MERLIDAMFFKLLKRLYLMPPFTYDFSQMNFQSSIPMLCNKFRVGSCLSWRDVSYRWYF